MTYSYISLHSRYTSLIFYDFPVIMLLYSLPDDKAKGKNRKKVKNCPHKSMELPTLLGNYDKPTDEQTDGYTGS